MESISVSSVLLFPAILMFFGCFVYGAGFAAGLREHTLPKYRWVGLVLFAFAAYVGGRFLYRMFEPGVGAFYRAMLQGRKVIFAHYAAFVLPLVMIVAVVVLERWFTRFRRDMV